MDLESQAYKVITDTCTHWICADEKELDRCILELKEGFEIIINNEIERRQNNKKSNESAKVCKKCELKECAYPFRDNCIGCFYYK